MTTGSTPSSRRRRRLGSQTPSKLAEPDYDATELDACLAICEAGGLVPLEWQRNVLAPWLAVDGDGMWLSRTCGLSVPRQNGKTLGTVAARAVYGMLARNELIVYTSHSQTTSTETFEGLRDVFESRRLRRYVRTIRSALGREAIVLKSGARIKFYARTRNGGRGKHGDLLIFDEAQELTDSQQASFQPCTSASGNPQVIYLGTPPDENAPGVVFRRIRDRALGGEPGRSWAEWSVDEIGDVADRNRWYLANPSLGALILESAVESECADYAPDKFAIERLGWWSPAEGLVEHVIDAEAWALCETDEPPEPIVTCAGVKFGPDRATLAYCLRPAEGACYVEWVDTRPLSEGVGWVAAWLDARRDRVATVAIDGGSTAALTTRLADLGYPRKAVVTAGPRDMARAVSMLTNAVAEHDLSHYGQGELTDSATRCAKRRIGGDGVGFEDAGGADATLIEACALALWQARTTRRRPGRRLRVG